MSRLIDADALKESMGEPPLNWNNSPEEIQEMFDWNNFTQLIDDAPTIDAVPVVHGHWITKTRHEHYPSGKEYEEDFCSACGMRGSLEYTYCPACGCRMDEVSEWR